MRAWSLRVRATVAATLIAAVVLVLGSVALVLTLDRHLTAGSDELARSRVDDLLALARTGSVPRTLVNLGDNGVAQVVAPGGRVLGASENITGKPAIASFATATPQVRTVRAPDDAESETYRLWGESGRAPQGLVRIYVGTSLEAVHEATSTLRKALYVGVPLVLLLLAAGTWWVVGVTLRRLDRIRAEVETVTEDRLDRRLPDDDRSDEVGRLARTMNRMLERLEASARRQRDLVADVSHDLQSPLAAQRTELEVALARGTDEETARRLLATNEDMERLVGDLLVLASADAEAAPGTPPGLLDLDDVVLEEVARARTGAHLVLDTGGVSGAPARIADGDARRIVRNLLDNALAQAASRVELRLCAVDGVAVLEVGDDGPGVPEEERERIFDRFHRGDAARSRHTSGSGLGLAIARSLAERAGGSLTYDDRGVGACFVLRLPSA